MTARNLLNAMEGTLESITMNISPTWSLHQLSILIITLSPHPSSIRTMITRALLILLALYQFHLWACCLDPSPWSLITVYAILIIQSVKIMIFQEQGKISSFVYLLFFSHACLIHCGPVGGQSPSSWFNRMPLQQALLRKVAATLLFKTI